MKIIKSFEDNQQGYDKWFWGINDEGELCYKKADIDWEYYFADYGSLDIPSMIRIAEQFKNILPFM